MSEAITPPPTPAGTVAEALNAAKGALAARGIESARIDAELLLAEATGRERAALIADGDGPVDAKAARAFGTMVRRRLQREPIAYILARKGFRRIELRVDRRVLVPRPETELLVELALELSPSTVLDVGTGSGAIALAVADELPGVTVVATDTSESALAVAAENASLLGFADRVELLAGSVPADRSFDLILANLPYVPAGDRATIQEEVRHEPAEALYAGSDGLEVIRSLLSAPLPSEAIGLEVGEGQADAVVALVAAAGFAAVETRRDLAGIERLVVGRGGSR